MPGSLNVLLTAAQRNVVADLLLKLADRLKLDQKNPRTISFTAKELETIRGKAEVARPHADNGMKRNSLRHVVDVVSKALKESEGIGSIPASERLYQFKITLLESQPPIWRRIQVKNGTLDKLHEHIQTAMGWTNSHLHQFEIDGERFGDPELLDDGFEDFECVDSTVTKISKIAPKDGKRFRFLYEYDFGDGWEHEILFEGCLKAEKGGRYPLCVEGERNCPPEDVGGVWGYAEFLEAIADPKHEQHDDFVEWAGEFDPEEFDAGETTKAMRRGLPDWRQMR
ncbi:plasmid pRiA4b ORF-3 family protein [Thalassoroseus pseudoceratinae]|uniref:plasmid pRiA4b ORF-3 family protein n=1 Tax=Thalassoroseus pseudoceratinae TaxID=2713176 RepID=UPI001423E8FE|nr:plasmid pRiA4b ORF-3 family protein [Thalassoroseus pseudoceratinae]